VLLRWRAALIGGLDAEAKATAHQRMRNFAEGEAARPAGKPRIYSCSVRALAHCEGIMRDAAWSDRCEGTITSIRATCPRSSSEIAQVLSNGFTPCADGDLLHVDAAGREE
jgi:hypothetical protein